MPDPTPRKVTPAQLRRWVEGLTGERIAPSTMYHPERRNPWRQALEMLVKARPELIEGAVRTNADLDRLWRDPRARRDFESEHQAQPLAEGGEVLQRQTDVGYVEWYHKAFRAWGRTQLIEELTPAVLAEQETGQ